MSPRPASHKLAFWCFVLLSLTLLSSYFFKGPFHTGKQILGISFPSMNFKSSFNFSFENADISKIVQTKLSGKPGHYAIYVENLTTKEQYGFNESEVLPAASLYKVFLIAAVVEKIENQELKLTDTVTSSKKHLEQVFGGTDFGYEETPEQIEYTIDEALTRVGRISDNFAAIMLAEKIGWNTVQAVADKNGAANTRIKSPITTTPLDIATFFKKLYHGQVVSAAGSQKIIEYLSLNQLSNRLPARLPQGIKIVHKTGELSRVRHDAGIVYCCNTEEQKADSTNKELNSQPYVIVMMSKDLKYEDDGVETIADLSKEIYEYFNSKD